MIHLKRFHLDLRKVGWNSERFRFRTRQEHTGTALVNARLCAETRSWHRRIALEPCLRRRAETKRGDGQSLHLSVGAGAACPTCTSRSGGRAPAPAWMGSVSFRSGYSCPPVSLRSVAASLGFIDGTGPRLWPPSAARVKTSACFYRPGRTLLPLRRALFLFWPLAAAGRRPPRASHVPRTRRAAGGGWTRTSRGGAEPPHTCHRGASCPSAVAPPPIGPRVAWGCVP